MKKVQEVAPFNKDEITLLLAGLGSIALVQGDKPASAEQAAKFYIERILPLKEKLVNMLPKD